MRTRKYQQQRAPAFGLPSSRPIATPLGFLVLNILIPRRKEAPRRFRLVESPMIILLFLYNFRDAIVTIDRRCTSLGHTICFLGNFFLYFIE